MSKSSGNDLMSEYKNALIQRYLFKQRWDATFFKDRLGEYSKTAGASQMRCQKVWMCGPPGMQQTFDISFQEEKHKYEDPQSVVQIL